MAQMSFGVWSKAIAPVLSASANWLHSSKPKHNFPFTDLQNEKKDTKFENNKQNIWGFALSSKNDFSLKL